MFGQKIIRLNSIDSTNQFAMQLIEQGKADNGLIIITDQQTAGKGYGSNRWESEPNKNLTLTFIFKPDKVLAVDQFFLNKSVSLALYDLLMAVNLPSRYKIKIKWPNDIYVDNQKIAGILIGNVITGDRINYSVTGIGLNVNQTIFSMDIPNPVSLKNLTGEDFELQNVFRLLCNSMNSRFEKFNAKEFDRIDSEYQRHLFRLEEKNSFMVDNEEFEAVIKGVDIHGRLIIERNNLKRVFAFKEIEFVI